MSDTNNALPAGAEEGLWQGVWADIKPSVRAMLGDGVLFLCGLCILAVAFVGLIGLEKLGYPKEWILILEKLHFWGYFAVMAVLLIDLLFKVIGHAWSRK